MNALQLVVPKELQLDTKTAEAHEQLLNKFQSNPFTNFDGCRLLRISKTSFIRRLKPLLLHGLVIRVGSIENRKTLYQAKDFSEIEKTTSETLFEEVQGEWKDFVGFVEF